MSLSRQCALLGWPRSTSYDTAQGERAENLHLMRLVDEQYTDTPSDGRRRMAAWLQSQGYRVNRKRVTRLLHPLGLETV